MTPSGSSIAFFRRGASQGLGWLKKAYRMLRAAPLPWLLLLFVYYVVMILLEFIPVAGRTIAPLLKPVFAVGFLAAAWSQERGNTPTPRDLFRGFKANLTVLLPLGFFFLGGMLLAIYATALVDDGKLLAILKGEEILTEEVLSSGQLQLAMLFGVACAVPTVLAMWFAPALVVFEDANIFSALSTSLRASLVNWRPIASYSLAVLFLGMIVPAMALGLVQVIAGSASVTFGVALLMPYLTFLIATLHISDYVSYRDVFHPDEVLSTVVQAPTE